MSKKPYLEAVEVEITNMKRRAVIDKEKYAFYQEVCKRLEQTTPKTAIRYKFADEETAERFRGYVSSNMRKDRGLDTLRTSMKQNDTGVYVYFARGKAY